MHSRSFLGIDTDTENDLVMVQRTEGRTLYSKHFQNTSADIRALVGFIRARCVRPRICLKATTSAAMKLLESLSGIPDVEVVFMSEAGLRMHRSLHASCGSAGRAVQNTQAELLARCAERMV